MAGGTRHGNWSEEDLENAMKAINRGDGGCISVREASRRFNIPRRTLRNHCASGSTVKRLGRKALLSTEIENELVQRIIRLADIGLPLNSKLVRTYVFDYMDRNSIPHPFTSTIAGEKWFRLFMKRWPQLRFRRAQAVNPARAQKLNRFIVADHFKKLKNILEEMGLFDQPQRIFNLDEKGCRLSLHHQQRVIVQKGQKRVRLVAPEHGENVTIVACVSGAGVAVPPMVIFKGKNRKESYGDDLPPLACFEIVEKGNMTHAVFVKCLKHFSHHKSPGRVLLIFDGAKCHLSIDIVEEADKHEVTLFCLPSNTTHELQPLDAAVFRSSEHHWDQEVLNFWRNKSDRSLTKDVFGKIFTPVWCKSMTMMNILNGFKTCGICPFNENCSPDHAFAPSEVTQMNMSAETVAAASKSATASYHRSAPAEDLGPLSSATPGSSSTTPGALSATSGASSATPGASSTTPGASSATPGASSATPGASSATPGASSATPGASSATPGASTATPGASSATPGASTATPGPSPATLGPSSATPGPSSATPGPSSATPGPSSATPRPSSATPDLSTATPDLSSATPDLSSKTPDLSSATPGSASSFHDIMATPLKTKKAQPQRKKSMNYGATVVSKSLFANDTDTESACDGWEEQREGKKEKGNLWGR